MKNALPKNLLLPVRKYLSLITKHVSFVALLAILLAYILVVWQISHLATAEPDSSSQVTAAKKIPKVDQKAINQIQALEANNAKVQSFFNQKRNNPFQE